MFCCRCMREEHVAKSFTALLTCNIKAPQHGNGQENQTERYGQDYYPNILYPKHHARICVFRSQNAPETIISPQSPSQDSKEKQVPVPFVDSWISICWSRYHQVSIDPSNPGILEILETRSPGLFFSRRRKVPYMKAVNLEGPPRAGRREAVKDLWLKGGFSAWVDDHWIIESPAVKSMLCNAEFGCYMMLREIQQYKQETSGHQ
jgi:hypothetical protein